jgi:magnesium chelatase family protein
VLKARKRQTERFETEKGIFKNADMSSKDINKYCKLDEASEAILKMAMTKLNLSARGYDRIRKVARTIADLDDSDAIKPEHISEAIQYRTLDRDYWNF